MPAVKKKTASGKRAPKPAVRITFQPEVYQLHVSVDGEEGTEIIEFGKLTPEIRVEAVREALERKLRGTMHPLRAARQILAGVWPARGTGGETGGRRAPKLVAALARVTGQSLDECHDLWRNADDALKKRLREDYRVKAMLATMKAEMQAQQTPDDDVLSSLMPQRQTVHAAVQQGTVDISGEEEEEEEGVEAEMPANGIIPPPPWEQQA